MRLSGIAAALKGLRFASGRTVKIKLADPETRDHLVAVLTRHCERTR